MTKKYYLPITALLIAASCCLVVNSTAHAQQSQLRQQIKEPSCTETNTCKMKPPTIGAIDKNNGKPLINGTYDNVIARHLRVTFNGKTYVLGVDSELTADGNVWTLDLREIAKPLASGNYQLSVEAEDGNGKTLRDVATITFADDNTSKSDDKLSDTGQNIILFLAVALGLVGIGGVLFLRQRGRE